MCFNLFKNTHTYNYYDQTTRLDFQKDHPIFLVGANASNSTKYGSDVDKLISITPSKRQLEYLNLKYYNFIHFGMNTFTSREWGDGKTSPSKFKLKHANTDQWAEVLKASGSKGIILTAKHHDGFCLWPSAYTNYTIKNSPYKQDLVKQLADSCKKYDLKFGIYLSPWDMHEKSYGKNSYNQFFLNQLEELLTNYGEIFSVWFDGARGEGVNIDDDFEYAWDDYYALIRKLQPNAVICVSGPDVRWVGNEAGVSRESEWSVIGAGLMDQEYIASLSQQNENRAKELMSISETSQDLGSRNVLKAYKEYVFAPAEVDVSIRKGWFYHFNQKPKSLEHLLKIYFKAVGGNSSLLLNVAPNKAGVIPKRDVKVLRAFGSYLNAHFASTIEVAEASILTTTSASSSEQLYSILNKDGSLILKDDEYIIDLDFKDYSIVRTIALKEDLSYSQRVEKFSVYLKLEDNLYLLVSNNTIIGSCRYIVLDPKDDVKACGIRIVFEETRNNPALKNISIFA